jgi:autotransporter translocation and assembly factor TamB
VSAGTRARRLLIALAAALAALVVCAIGVVGALHVPSVQRRVLDEIEAAVTASIHGRLELGDLSGALLFGHVEVGPSRLEDERGRALVSVERASVNVEWLDSLLAGGLVAEAIVVASPRVWMEVDAHGNSFSRLPKNTATDTSTSPTFSPVDIVVRDATLQDGSFELVAPDRRLYFADVEATLSGAVGAERIDATVAHLGASSALLPEGAHVRGAVALHPDHLTGHATVEDAAGSVVTLADARLDYTGVRIRTDFDARIEPPTVARYAPGPTIQGALAGTFEHEADGAWKLAAEGHTLGADVDIDATADDAFDAITAKLDTEPGVDLSRLHAALPASALAVHAIVALTDLPALTGTAKASIEGRVNAVDMHPLLIRSLEANARVDDGAFVASAHLDADGAELDADAEGRLDRFELDRADLSFTVPRLARLLGRPRIDGHVRGHATLRDAKVAARLRGRHVLFDGVKAGRVDVRADLEAPFEAPRGTAKVDVEGLAVEAQHLGDVRLRVKREGTGPYDVTVRSRGGAPALERVDAALAVDLTEDRVVAEIRRLRARAIGSRWRVGRGARVALADDFRVLTVDALSVSTEDTRVSAKATIDLGAQRIEALRVDVPELHVNTLRRAGWLPRGEVDGAWSAKVRTRDGILHADVAVFGDDVGRGRAAARVTLPRRPFDVGAWRRLTADDVRRLKLDLARLDVGAVQRMFGVRPVVTGAASGGITFARGQLRRGAIDLDDGRIEGLSRDVAVYVSVEAPERPWVRVRVTGVLDGTPVLASRIEVNADPIRLRRDGLEALRAANFTANTHLTDFPLSAIEGPRRMAGVVTGTVAVARRHEALDLVVDAEATRVRLGERWPLFDLTVDGRSERGRVEVDARLRTNDAGHLTLAARGRAPADATNVTAWTQMRLDDLETIEVHADGARLEAWGRAFDLDGLRGVLGLDALVRARGRTGEASVRLDGFSMGDRAAIDAQVYVDGRPDRTTLEATAFANERPILEAHATSPLSLGRLTSTSTRAVPDLPVDATIAAEQIPLALVAALLDLDDPLAGHVAIDGELSGRLGDPQLAVHVVSEDLGVGDTRFETFDVDVNLDAQRFAADVSVRQVGGGRLELDGTLGLGGDDTLDLDLDASELQLDFLSPLIGANGAFGGVAGRIDGNVSMDGTRRRPLVAGALRLEDVRAVLVHPVPPMEHVDGELLFEDDRLRFALRGASGDGRFTYEGEAHADRAGRLEMSSELEVADVAVAAGPKILETDLSAKIELLFAEQLDVDVLVTDGNVKLPSRGASERLPVERLEHVVVVDELGAAPPAIESANADDGSALAYRVQVRTAGQVPIRSADLNANLVADLTVAQADGPPTTSGFVEVTSGTVNLFGRQWTIDNADVRFAAGRDRRPRLDVRVRHDFPNVTVYVAVSGSPEDPRVRFSSDPAIFSQDQLIGFVLGGTPSSSEEDAPLADQAVGAATGFLLGEVQSRLQDKLPIDTISVDLDDTASAEAVSVGKWISSRIFVAYNLRLAPESDENANAGLVQFRLGRGWMLETTYGDRGNGSADILYRKRF